MATTTLRVTHLGTDTRTSRSGRGERTMKKLYALVTGLALGLGVLMGSASAGEKFTLLKNIPAQALSQSEMAAVEGKLDPLDGPTFIPFNYWPSYRGYQTIRGPGIAQYAASQLVRTNWYGAPYLVPLAFNPWGAAPSFSGISPYGYSVCQGVIGVRC